MKETIDDGINPKAIENKEALKKIAILFDSFNSLEVSGNEVNVDFNLKFEFPEAVLIIAFLNKIYFIH